MPLVYSADGPDRASLPQELKLTWNWIVLTSPEAAAVFLEAWQAAGQLQVQVAVVGQGTANILEDFPGFDKKYIRFIPTKADGKTLASTLPSGREGITVLYPASAKASTDVQDILKSRGFKCKMIRTYTTKTVEELTQQQLDAAASARVVTFASPSAIKAWVKHCGGLTHQKPVACIGKTTADAAKALGLQKVYWPDNPGIAGFVASIMDALASEQ
ncbi:hypothetical protein WJX84_006925 [Apatococcus fuscideae]|uniref:Uroporphyrinogen-III synthase n=1 Tax=Apatococcus fuscideae TaxID=2026836 RepID=A0AAW1SS65_9CHLO